MSNPILSENVAPRILPVFPLPDTVLFPRTTITLQIVEPCYVAMVRDVIAGERRIVASLASGDDFTNLGTVGRVYDVELLEGGLFKLRLEGLERVSLTEVPSETSYRQVQVLSRPERTGTDDVSAVADAGLELLASYGILRRMVLGDEPTLLHQEIPFEVVVNKACASLPIDASLRQRLLDEDSLMDRQRLGLELVSTVIETLSWLRATVTNVSSLIN